MTYCYDLPGAEPFEMPKTDAPVEVPVGPMFEDAESPIEIKMEGNKAIILCKLKPTPDTVITWYAMNIIVVILGVLYSY